MNDRLHSFPGRQDAGRHGTAGGRPPRWWRALVLLCGCLLGLRVTLAADADRWRVGTAQVNITPTTWMWMGGFAARTKPAEGKLDDLFAKGLVLEAPDGGVAVLLTANSVEGRLASGLGPANAHSRLQAGGG